MTGKSRNAKEAALPVEPKWVVIEATDGNSSRWPRNTVENPDNEGYVNFMNPIAVDDGLAIKWRIVVGQALAEMLKYPDLESRSWVLKDWPEGYHFYDHNKGQLGGKVRHDLYLVGSTNVARFRSPQEFIPHAYWLMTDPSQDRSTCECKYCAGKPQREISGAMGLSQRQGGSPSLARFIELPRRERRRRVLPAIQGRSFAIAHRVPAPIKLPKGPEQHSNPEREKDLRALLGPKSLGERRWAREGELVWVKLDYPIPVNDQGAVSEEITFWPGMIEEVNFKAEVIPKPSHASTNGDSVKVDDSDPWTIVHKPVFTVNLLAVSKTVMYGSDHILPYQSHAPDGELLNEVQSIIFDLGGEDDLGGFVLPFDSQPPPEQTEQAEQALFKRFHAFDPFPPARPSFSQVDEQRFYSETAAGAFATAIQIASRLTMYWTPTDDWEYKLQSNPVAYDWPNIPSTSNSSFTPAESQALVQNSLGIHSSGPGTTETQIRFQGLWWGPERIWMGDVVRLTLGRYQLSPEGSDLVKKPSGAALKALAESNNGLHSSPLVAHNNTQTSGKGGARISESMPIIEDGVQDDSRNYGAWPRSLFLRVDGLFVVQVPTEDGQGRRNECRMCGMLFELADDDWEPEGEEFGQTESQMRVATMTAESISQSRRDSPGRTTATPIRAVMSNNGGSVPTNATNGASVESVAPETSSTSLFTPNPELLFEPPAQADIFMADGTTEQPPSMPPNDSVKEQADPSEPKTESAVPPNPSLSGPLKSAAITYPTPPAPHNLKFRPILRDGHEVIMPLTTLAGRYYPSLLSNSLLQSRVLAALENPHTQESKAIRALEGLVPGCYNAVDAMKFVPRRGKMLREAESIAWRELVDYWRRRAAEKRDEIVIDVDN